MESTLAPPATIALGERVYDSIPPGLQTQWDHVQVEAAMRSKLQEAQAIAVRLKDAPKTYSEIERALHDFETQTMVPDVLNALFSVGGLR
jgi:hypothetical protein